jgi:hypothetical protein
MSHPIYEAGKPRMIIMKDVIHPPLIITQMCFVCALI